MQQHIQGQPVAQPPVEMAVMAVMAVEMAVMAVMMAMVVMATTVVRTPAAMAATMSVRTPAATTVVKTPAVTMVATALVTTVGQKDTGYTVRCALHDSPLVHLKYGASSNVARHLLINLVF